MKKILLLLIICVCIACNAESLYNISMLKGTKWIETTSPKDNTYMIEFSETSILGSITFIRLNKTANFQWPYYLTENYVEEFNDSLVGHSQEGRYLNHYNDRLNETFSEKIITLNEDSLVLFHKVKDGYIGGKDHTIVYKRVK